MLDDFIVLDVKKFSVEYGNMAKTKRCKRISNSDIDDKMIIEWLMARSDI